MTKEQIRNGNSTLLVETKGAEPGSAGDAILIAAAKDLVEILEDPFAFLDFLLIMIDKSHYYSIKKNLSYDESESYFFIRIIRDLIVPWFASTKAGEVQHIADGLEELYQSDYAEGYNDSMVNMLDMLCDEESREKDYPKNVVLSIKVMHRIGRALYEYEQTINSTTK